MQTRDVPTWGLWPFLIVTFAIPYAVFALLVTQPAQMEALFGPISVSNPLFIFVVWSPALSAWGVILATTGWRGFVGYLRRLTVLRGRLLWWVILMIGIPLVFYAGALIKGAPFRLWPFDSWGEAAGAIGIMMILGPIEEFGWRDLMQPLVQRKMAPFWAALVVGAAWGLWHLPAFFLSGIPQANWDVLPFLIGAVAISVLITPLFNEGGGAILLPMIYHFQFNNQIFPDAMPYDIPIWVALAALVVWICRARIFDRSAGVTHVTALAPRH